MTGISSFDTLGREMSNQNKRLPNFILDIHDHEWKFVGFSFSKLLTLWGGYPKK